MCRRIAPEFVIGNVFIEALKANRYSIKVEKIIEFDDRLSEIFLKRIDSYSKVDFVDVYSTAETYSCFFKISNDEVSLIMRDKDSHAYIDDIEEKEVLSKRLSKYFRVGLPLDIIKAFKETSELVFNY
jgi:hypothetical protein